MTDLIGNNYYIIIKDDDTYIYNNGESAFTGNIQCAKQYYSLSSALSHLEKLYHYKENNVRIALVELYIKEVDIIVSTK